MKNNKLPFIFRSLICLCFAIPTILELLFYVIYPLNNLDMIPQPLATLKVMCIMFMGGGNYLLVVVMAVLFVIPPVACLFVRKKRILFSCFTALPFSVHTIFLLFSGILGGFFFCGLFDAICLLLSILVLWMESKSVMRKID